MREYLVRLLYCHMLGYDVTFAYIQAIKLAQQGRLLEKQAGNFNLIHFVWYIIPLINKMTYNTYILVRQLPLRQVTLSLVQKPPCDTLKSLITLHIHKGIDCCNTILTSVLISSRG